MATTTFTTEKEEDKGATPGTLLNALGTSTIPTTLEAPVITVGPPDPVIVDTLQESEPVVIEAPPVTPTPPVNAIKRRATISAVSSLMPTHPETSKLLEDSLAILTNTDGVPAIVIGNSHLNMYRTLVSVLSNSVVYNEDVVKTLVLGLLDRIESNPTGFDPFKFLSNIKQTLAFTAVDHTVYTNIITIFLTVANQETRRDNLSRVKWNQLKYIFSQHPSGEAVIERLMTVFNVL